MGFFHISTLLVIARIKSQREIIRHAARSSFLHVNQKEHFVFIILRYQLEAAFLQVP